MLSSSVINVENLVSKENTHKKNLCELPRIILFSLFIVFDVYRTIMLVGLDA